MRKFEDLSEKELLALAIGLEEEDGRIYADFAEGLRNGYPASAKVFAEMAAEENEHRRRLIDLFEQKFGPHIPFIRRRDVRGFIERQRIWQMQPLGVDRVRRQAADMEREAARFYQIAAGRASDTGVRKLLGDLAAEEGKHEHRVEELEAEILTEEARLDEDEQGRRRLLLQVIQPGLVGLMVGLYRPWRQSSPRPSLRGIRGVRSQWGSPLQLALESRWGLRRRWPTTASYPAEARPCCEDSSAG
jgi:erythrin-vacuolar iron transport family protein